MRSDDDTRARMRRKYVEIRRLRAAPPGPPPTAALRALAAEFPGALRELDAMPLDAIDRRIAELDAGEPAWLAPLDRFHRRLAGALAVKRWIGAREGEVDAAALERELAGDPEALAWRDELDRIAAPPGGRLVGVVVDRVARELALDDDVVRAALGGRG